MSKTLDYIALIIVFIGALNWGLIGLFRLDLGENAVRGYELDQPSGLRARRDLRNLPADIFWQDRQRRVTRRTGGTGLKKCTGCLRSDGFGRGCGRKDPAAAAFSSGKGGIWGVRKKWIPGENRP